MRGFDRPIRPDWAYDFINVANRGDSIAGHKKDFDEILWMLDGEDGKRKVITVIARYYLRSPEHPNGKYVCQLPISNLCKNNSLEEVKPLLLFYLLIRAPILVSISELINDIYGYGKFINYDFLRHKIIGKMGERDISIRSLRNFLNTLEYFNILEKTDGGYSWKGRLPVSSELASQFLKIYAEEYLHSPQLILDNMNKNILMYFNMPNFDALAKRYNGKLWDYSIKINKKVILFKKCYNKKRANEC